MSPNLLRKIQRRLGEDVLDDFSVDVGEAEVSTGVMVGEPGMVKSQDVEDGRVKVVDVYLVADDVITGFVGGDMHEAGFDTSAGEP